MNRSLGDIRVRETQVLAAELVRRRNVLIAVGGAGALIGLCAMFLIDTTIDATIAGVYDFVLASPNLEVLIHGAPGIIAGAVLAILCTLFIANFRAVDVFPWRWLLIGILFGTALPFFIGLLNLVSDSIVLYLQVSNLPLSFIALMREALLDTPRHMYVYGLSGIYFGWSAGAVLALLAWVSDIATRLTKRPLTTYVLTLLAVAIALAIFLGPIELLDTLIRNLGNVRT